MQNVVCLDRRCVCTLLRRRVTVRRLLFRGPVCQSHRHTFAHTGDCDESGRPTKCYTICGVCVREVSRASVALPVVRAHGARVPELHHSLYRATLFDNFRAKCYVASTLAPFGARILSIREPYRTRCPFNKCYAPAICHRSMLYTSSKYMVCEHACLPALSSDIAVSTRGTTVAHRMRIRSTSQLTHTPTVSVRNQPDAAHIPLSLRQHADVRPHR
jgi:hypothetical protein